MPDLTTEFYWQCSSVAYFECSVASHSKPDTTYTVTKDHHGVWHCTCRQGQFTRFGVNCRCVHVTEARTKYCGWLALIDPRPVVITDGHAICPACGGLAVSVAYAV